MKLELLVIAGQLYRGEYVLKFCTQNERRRAAIIARRLKSFLRASVIAEGQVAKSDLTTEGPDVAKDSL